MIPPLSGLHNCCRGCNNAIEQAITGSGATAQAGADMIIIAEDEATAQAAVDAIAAAGFWGQTDSGSVVFRDSGDDASGQRLVGFHTCCGSCPGPSRRPPAAAVPPW